jgi:hypothetical protein
VYSAGSVDPRQPEESDINTIKDVVQVTAQLTKFGVAFLELEIEPLQFLL